MNTLELILILNILLINIKILHYNLKINIFWHESCKERVKGNLLHMYYQKEEKHETIRYVMGILDELYFMDFYINLCKINSSSSNLLR
jgi:hypothetical protein